VILFRCFAWDAGAEPAEPGGPMWFPRVLQGEGRHDAPELYGCLYVSESPASAVVEELAPLAGSRFAESDLMRNGLPLALATLDLPDEARLADLDDPFTLAMEELRPSEVATRERRKTQSAASLIYRRHVSTVGIRWWSTFDPGWANVTLFDRARDALDVADVRRLRIDDDVVGEAVRFLGLRTAA
jgi:hypothetical protein